jgi:hypothetical protein
VLFAIFIAIEAVVAEPLMPLRFFRLETLAVSNVIGILWSAAMFAWFFLSALYLQRVLGYTPMQVGLAFLPGNLIMAACSLGISAWVVNRFGIRRPLVAGLAAAALGLALFARAPVDGGFVVDVLPGCWLLGLGAGIAFNPLLLAAMTGVDEREAGLASGIVNTSFMMGGALGLAVLASLAAAYAGAPGAAGGAAEIAAANAAISSPSPPARCSRSSPRRSACACRRGRRRRRRPCRRRPGPRSRQPSDLHADDLPRAVAAHVDVDVAVVAGERLVAVAAGHPRAAAQQRDIAVEADLEVLDRVRVDRQRGVEQAGEERRLGLELARRIDLAEVVGHVGGDRRRVLAHDRPVPGVGLPRQLGDVGLARPAGVPGRRAGAAAEEQGREGEDDARRRSENRCHDRSHSAARRPAGRAPPRPGERGRGARPRRIAGRLRRRRRVGQLHASVVAREGVGVLAPRRRRRRRGRPRPVRREDDEGIVGTVQLVLDLPENQPHRADVSKMLVHRRARRRASARR